MLEVSEVSEVPYARSWVPEWGMWVYVVGLHEITTLPEQARIGVTNATWTYNFYKAQP